MNRTAPIVVAAVLVASVGFATILGARRALRRAAGEPVPPYPEAVARSPGRGLWVYFPYAALGTFLILVLSSLSPAGVEPKIMALLGAAAAHVLAGTWLISELAPWAFGARRLDEERERAVTRLLAGRVRRVWVSPYPMIAGPTGSVAMIAGRSLFVWSPLASLEPEELAYGAAFRASRRRAWPVGIAAFAAARLVESSSGISVAPWTGWSLLAASLVAAALSEGGWLFARRRAWSSDAAAARSAVTGTLAIGRQQARLSATGALPSVGAMRLATVAELIWRRAQTQATGIAARARIDAGVVPEMSGSIVERDVPAETLR